MAEYKHREGIGRVVEAACGLRHVLCVTEKGHVFAWGDNRLLQLGVSTSNAAFTVNSLEDKEKRGVGHTQRKVLSLRRHGDSGEAARVLHLHTMPCCGPVHLYTLAHIHVVMVACGTAHSLCLDQQGRVFSGAWHRVVGSDTLLLLVLLMKVMFVVVLPA